MTFILMNLGALLLVFWIISMTKSIATFQLLETKQVFSNDQFRDMISEVYKDKSYDEIYQKVESKRFYINILVIVTLGYIMMLVSYAMLLMDIDIKTFLIVEANSVIMLIVYAVDTYFNYKELEKCVTDSNYTKEKEEEGNKLLIYRIIYIALFILLVISLIGFNEIYNIQTEDPNLYRGLWGAFLMYMGGGGLLVKMAFIKLPINPTGKLQPIINGIILVIGLSLLFLSLLS